MKFYFLIFLIFVYSFFTTTSSILPYFLLTICFSSTSILNSSLPSCHSYSASIIYLFLVNIHFFIIHITPLYLIILTLNRSLRYYSSISILLNFLICSLINPFSRLLSLCQIIVFKLILLNSYITL